MTEATKVRLDEIVVGERSRTEARNIESLAHSIRESSKRMEEEKANIAMYRALLTLLRDTGQFTVRAALAVGQTSLEDYLATADQRRRAA